MKKLMTLVCSLVLLGFVFMLGMSSRKTYIIAPSEDIFAFMHHERHNGLGVKTQRFSVSYQIQRTEKTGALSVQYPFSLKPGNNITNVVLSKEGYFPYIGDIEKSSKVGVTNRLGNQITLQKNEDYAGEALSLLLVKQYTKKFEQEKDPIRKKKSLSEYIKKQREIKVKINTR